MELFFFFVEKNLTRCDIWKKLALFLHPMQHLFASMMNLNATFLVWKKILNMVRYLEEAGSFCFDNKAISDTQPFPMLVPLLDRRVNYKLIEFDVKYPFLLQQ